MMKKNCKTCMDGAPGYYCCLLICGELEVCRYCDWSRRRVVTRCPMEEKEKMNKILEMGESKKCQNESPNTIFELKFKPIVSEMCTLEEINRYFSQKTPGTLIQGTLGNQFGVRYISHTSESVKVQLVFKEFNTKPNFDDYRLVMVPNMCFGKPYNIAYIQFSLAESPAPACDIHANADKVWDSASKENSVHPDEPVLVDITDMDYSWVENLSKTAQIMLFNKLCALGANRSSAVRRYC